MTDFSITPTAVVTAIAVLIPLLVGAISKRTASSTMKALLNALGTAGLSAVALWLAAPPANLANFFLTWALAFVVSGAAHTHLWKPLGVSEAVSGATARVGLGRGPATPADEAVTPP